MQEFLHAKLTLSKATQRNYRLRLGAFVTWCEQEGLELEALKASHIRTYIASISARTGITGGPVRSSTVQGYALTVKVFLNWCAREEDLETGISQKMLAHVQVPKAEQVVIETFTPKQLDAMLRATDAQPFPERARAIVCVLIDTGIRASELCGLTLDCVWLDADDSYIKVFGKGRKEREIALGRTARIAVRRYVTRYRGKPKRKDDRHVFLSRIREPLTVSGLETIIERVGRTARVKGVRCSPHTFRHTFACSYLLGGGDLYKLSRLMGHTSTKITERYLQAIKAKQARQGKSVLDELKAIM